MRFVMIDGLNLEGDSFTDIVRLMAGEKLDKPQSLDSYRVAVADRVKEGMGLDIDPRTDETFVLGMVGAGLMKRLA